MATAVAIEPPHWPLQPFERKLLIEEVASLAGSAATWRKGSVWLSGADAIAVELLRERLAFARSVAGVVTNQHLLEQAAGKTKRKVTWHALHGLHPYKGKFYPQLARSLINVCGLKAGARLLDPFAGCGTSVLEARLLGLRAVGVDANPLAVLVSRTKLELLGASPRRLARDFEAVAEWRGRVPKHPDHEYLATWFPRQNLKELTRLLEASQPLTPKSRRAVLVVLSSVLREASLQVPQQVRVYRRPASDVVPDLADLFIQGATRLAGELSAIQNSGLELAKGRCKVVEGDARQLTQLLKDEEPFDAVITSPPYASALPYLDTDRLSLRALSLIAGSHRQAEDRLIGNREITGRLQQELERELDDAAWVPRQLRTVLNKALLAAEEPTAGFRKQRTPALLFRYFRDMRQVLEEIASVTTAHAPVVIVIGDNTVGGPQGTSVVVPTADLLVELAAHSGLTCRRRLRKRLTSYGAKDTVHQRNAMNGEEVLFLEPSR